MCEKGEESVNHWFLQCTISTQLGSFSLIFGHQMGNAGLNQIYCHVEHERSFKVDQDRMEWVSATI